MAPINKIASARGRTCPNVRVFIPFAFAVSQVRDKDLVEQTRSYMAWAHVHQTIEVRNVRSVAVGGQLAVLIKLLNIPDNITSNKVSLSYKLNASRMNA